MAKNIFSMFQGYVPKPKRNVFDLSFNNNFTTKFGQLTPVLCKEVIPGDSFKIETAAGLRLMPMAFPVQTPMKAYVHYFYVRNRALWKDWQDFITGTKSGLVPPYVDFSMMTSAQKKDFFKVGGLADFLGVPNTIYGNFGRTAESDLETEAFSNIIDGNSISLRIGEAISSTYAPYISQSLQGTANNDVQHYPAVDSLDLVGQMRTSVLLDLTDYADGIHTDTWYAGNTKAVNPLQRIGNYQFGNVNIGSLKDLSIVVAIPFAKGNNIFENTFKRMPFYLAGYDLNKTYTVLTSVNAEWNFVYEVAGDNNQGVAIAKITLNEETLPLFSSLDGIDLFCYPLLTYNAHTSTEEEPYTGVFNNAFLWGTDLSKVDLSSYDIEAKDYTYVSYLDYSGSGNVNTVVIGDGNYSSTPYDSDIPLSALPFRAYECIYNSYYRNMQNNPYILNGVEEYNKFIPSNEGGADTNIYPLHQRNWEYDFMTSAVPSPQFGIAPLVGITMTGTATFQDENGTTYYAQAEYDDDGTITGWSTHSSNMPAGTLRMLMDSVGTGISINDLRNVNSFQRFLENSLRVGLKYRDQIKGHFGVEVRYDELEMPEFIGGMSLDINVNQVTQTADVQDSSYPLAGFAGQAGAFGSSKHSVTKYCDEHGFIIGILSVVPVPVYSQLLPKFFSKNEQLDYFFPEFGHIGYQPILQKEISPLQTYYAGDDLNNVFGYQRAWYDYIASTDEVHGQFRTTLRDFVMNRTFDEPPALNEDFLLVDPEQVNDVFLVTSDGEYGPEADKILGQLYFKITKKSPIPILGIPRLTD